MFRMVVGLLPIAVIAVIALRAGWHLNQMQAYRRGGLPELRDRKLDDWFRGELYSETGRLHQARGLRLLKVAIGIMLAYAALLLFLNGAI
jgi:hypothetical protein